jgi:predicted MFS family arabinose efflux permease
MTASPNAPARPVAAEWQIALAGLTVIAVSYGFARYGFGLFVPQIRREYGLSTSALGLIGSATYVGYLAALILVGILATRVGPRLLLVCAGASATSGLAIVAIAPTTSVLVIGLVLAATSSGWAWTPYSDVVDRVVRRERQQHVMALLPVGTAFGVAVAGPLALLAGGGGWRYAWMAFSVAALLATLYNARTVPSAMEQCSPDEQAPVGLHWFVRRPAVPLYLTSLSYGLVGSVYWTFAIDAITSAGTISGGREPVFWTLIGVAGIGGLGTGALMARLELIGTHRVLFVALAVAVGLMGATPGMPALVAVSVVVYGPAFMAVSGLLAVWSHRLFTDRPSTGFSATVFFLGLGSIAGPLVMGLIAERYGLGAALVLTAAIAAGTVVATPSAVSRRTPAADRRTSRGRIGTRRLVPRRSPRADG